MIELAKRAVECKYWKWMPGMLALGDIASDSVRVIKADVATIESYDMVASTNAIVIDGLKRWNYLPDLTDAATLGCLLALVRKAWHSPESTTQFWPKFYDRAAYWQTRANGYEFRGATEVEALIAALEAAP